VRFGTSNYSRSEPGTYGAFHHGELTPSSRKAAELAKVAIQAAVDAAVAAELPEAAQYQLTQEQRNQARYARGRLARLRASQKEHCKAEQAFHAPIAKPAAKAKAAM
jgi:hypothetical protein